MRNLQLLCAICALSRSRGQCATCVVRSRWAGGRRPHDRESSGQKRRTSKDHETWDLEQTAGRRVWTWADSGGRDRPGPVGPLRTSGGLRRSARPVFVRAAPRLINAWPTSCCRYSSVERRRSSATCPMASPGLPCASATSRSPSTALIPIAGSSPRAAVAWPALQCSTTSSYRPVPTARGTRACAEWLPHFSAQRTPSWRTASSGRGAETAATARRPDASRARAGRSRRRRGR